MKIIVTVEGMMCAHCEMRVNKAIQKAFPGTIVTSSHKEKQTTILTGAALDTEQVMQTIYDLGYEPKGVRVEE